MVYCAKRELALTGPPGVATIANSCSESDGPSAVAFLTARSVAWAQTSVRTPNWASPRPAERGRPGPRPRAKRTEPSPLAPCRQCHRRAASQEPERQSVSLSTSWPFVPGSQVSVARALQMCVAKFRWGKQLLSAAAIPFDQRRSPRMSRPAGRPVRDGVDERAAFHRPSLESRLG